MSGSLSAHRSCAIMSPTFIAASGEIVTNRRPHASPSPQLGQQVMRGGAPSFHWHHLWGPPIINPLNRKSYTLPIFNLKNPYSRAFHLSWLGFFVAFLSWFAFPPLMPVAIKNDLKLSHAEIANSNIVALVATLVVRVVSGPLVDRYGPRKVMAGLLILGAIPSGLAGTAHSAETLYILRFFIGILGGTFIPCQAWTSCFFDSSVVGRANAFVGGWGNMGGGAAFAIMVSTYSSLRSDGLSEHSAWRVAFAAVPVPILLSVAVLTLVLGQDHPAGAWSQRHNLPATAVALEHGHHVYIDANEQTPAEHKDKKERPVETGKTFGNVISVVDFAVNESLTFESGMEILASPLTWLPALAYFTTFGLELALDAQMENTLFALFRQRISGFDQTRAGYYTSIFGFLNLVTRPFGGYLGDVVYKKHGTKGKKVLTLLCGLVMGVTFLAGGVYLQNNHTVPHPPALPVVMGIFAVAAIFSEIGNGANFGLVPHCNPYNNGVMTGIVGAFGNMGGIFFALIFRFQTASGEAFWIIGAICIILNVFLLPIPVPEF
ncbi:Nitrate/nitrite transporter [Mycena sanguinolenta]|uniref:Nitrate/nitrite transporter n=1 Tax=Mycena sanguinolenta TaxID=230812 RepID=A0A8H6YUY3_9AGAR|nr:Nitrate/nitrite transporter [Mycena sanguinolenta]